MFQGFSQQTVDFMWGIRFNNEKSWFEAHKADYQTYFLAPMKELGAQVQEALLDRFPKSGLNLKVSRIYRDARRLFGRGPYKDHLWFTVSQPAEDWSVRATFWFELTPEEYSYGLGYWMAKASTMAKLRARLDRDPKSFEKLVRPLVKDPRLELTGETFKRPKAAPTAFLEPWYNRKSGFSVGCTRSHDELLFTPALKDEILKTWEELTPLYRYLSTLDGDPDPSSSQSPPR